MRFVIVYDIEDDRTRNRIAKVLEGCGQRVQESVFECDLDAREARTLGERLLREMRDLHKGSVRFYRVCETCLEASFGFGDLGTLGGGSPCIILG
jgi:CRISPR-associated protein Cas2